MSNILRVNQAAIKRVHPHPGNRSVLLPNRRRGGVLPANPLVLYAFTSGSTEPLTALGNTLPLTRASIATYRDGTGRVVTAGSNEARFDYDNNGRALGLLLESGTTNYALNSATFEAATWEAVRATVVDDAAGGPDGKVGAATLADSTDDATHLFQSALTTLNAVPDNVDLMFSVWVRPVRFELDTKLSINARDGTFWQCNFRSQSGRVDFPGNAKAFGAEPYRNGWYRFWMVGEVASGGSDLRVSLRPVIDGQIGSFPGTGEVWAEIWGAQVEAHDGPPTSYIETLGLPVSREPDKVVDNAVDWFPGTRADGGIVAGHSVAGQIPVTQDYWGLTDDTTDEQWRHRSVGGANSQMQIRATGGQRSVVLPFPSPSPNTATTWTFGDNMRVYENGRFQGTVGLAGLVDAPKTRLDIGSGRDAQSEVSRLLHMRHWGYYDRRLTDEELAGGSGLIDYPFITVQPI